jgi:hypothetical protein
VLPPHSAHSFPQGIRVNFKLFVAWIVQLAALRAAISLDSSTKTHHTSLVHIPYYLGSFDINYIIIRNVQNFRIVFQITKNCERKY